MGILFSQGLRRWAIASVAVPLGIKVLTGIAGRLERAEGRTTLSRFLRGASTVLGRRGAGSRTSR